MTTTNTTNVGDILKQLETLNKATGIDIYIPSLGKAVKFKNLNLRQQKELLSTSIDESLTRLSFVVKFYNIIQENNLESINVSDLHIFDRQAIAIALRSNGIDKNYTTKGVTIDLEEQLNTIKNIDVNTYPLKAAFTVENMTVDIQAPTLGIDREVSSSAISKLKNVKDSDVKTLVSELFIHEIVKFIKTVTFTTEGGNQSVNFNTLKTEDKLTIAEKLPSTVTNKILDFIKNYRELENKIITSNNTTIEIDGSFFNV